MKSGSDVKEVEVLISNLKYLEKAIWKAIPNWKQDIGNCDRAITYMSGDLLSNICKNPTLLSKQVFRPLYAVLETYKKNREGKLAFTSASLDSYLRKTLRLIHQYVIVSDFFSKNPQYFVPDISISKGFGNYQKTITEQNKYKDFILTLNQRLIGCRNDLNFMFLKLISTVKNLPEDLQKMKEHLELVCNTIRVEKLKL